MHKTKTSAETSAKFRYDGKTVEFRGPDKNDHILSVMRRTGTFYERDVLERLKERIRKRGRQGAAVDAGAFIGTHSAYFAQFCGCAPVVSFEPNPATFPILLENLRLNDLEKAVVPINKALGAHAGHANVHPGEVGNRGTATISFDAQSDTIEVSTLDREVQRVMPTSPSVALIKIDVEGAELDVLKGSLSTIDKHMPVLCVEIHTARNLRKVLSILGRNPYWIIDCRGYSPTYILEATNSLLPRRYIVNSLWLTRAALPLAWLKIRWYLARTAQLLSVGKWDPPA